MQWFRPSITAEQLHPFPCASIALSLHRELIIQSTDLLCPTLQQPQSSNLLLRFTIRTAPFLDQRQYVVGSARSDRQPFGACNSIPTFGNVSIPWWWYTESICSCFLWMQWRQCLFQITAKQSLESILITVKSFEGHLQSSHNLGWNWTKTLNYVGVIIISNHCCCSCTKRGICMDLLMAAAIRLNLV